MPDIMMCAATGCARSPECYRHADSGTKPDEHRQSFWLRDATSPVADKCDNFWPRQSLAAKLDAADPNSFC